LSQPYSYCGPKQAQKILHFCNPQGASTVPWNNTAESTEPITENCNAQCQWATALQPTAKTESTELHRAQY